MLHRRGSALLGSAMRGLYFPINQRIVDTRIDPASVEETEVQSRYRRELRTSFTTGETRQTEAPAWSQRVRPTHFLSLPLPAKNTLTAHVKEVHSGMVFANQRMESLLVPIPKLHVTLGVMTLPEEETEAQLKAVQSCVQSAVEEVCRQPLSLRFRGLGTFSNGRVLFIRCVTEAHYTSLDNLVRRIRQDLGGGLGIDIKGNPHDSYVPHITLAKIRPQQRREFGTRIPVSFWADYQHHDFGEVTFGRLDVCSMKGKSDDGYYKVESSSVMTSA